MHDNDHMIMYSDKHPTTDTHIP